MANRKTKVVDEPRVPGVPTDLVTFNTIAWEAPRPKGVCLWVPEILTTFFRKF